MRELLDGLPDAIVAVDGAGRVSYLNRAAETLLGWPAAELLGRPAEVLLPERMRPRGGYRQVTTELRDGRARAISALRKNGVEVEVELAASVMQVNGEECVVASLRRRRDVVQPEGAVDPVYRLVFENASIGIWHFDARGVITACNEKFAAILGSPQRVLVGLDMLSLPDARMVECVKRSLAGEVARYEGDYLSATSGKTAPVHVDFTPIFGAGPDGARAVLGGVGLVEDISERASALDALRRSESAFRSLIENAPDAIAVFREDGRFIYVNPALVRMMGYEHADELLGRRVVELMHPDDRSGFVERVAATKHAAESTREGRFLRKDGKLVLAEVESRPIHFDGADAIIVLGRDITERKQLLKRLAQADRMASVGTLAAGIAHEINNPLAYVVASIDLANRKLDMLKSGRASPEAMLTQIAASLANAREGAERVSTIVRDLRTFSRADPNRCVPVDVERVIDSAVNMAWNELGKKARLVKDYGGVSAVLGDEARLGQVFLNLLINAAHAIVDGDPQTNEVRVTTRDLPNGRVIVEIADTGHGIPSEMIERIFEPFVTTKPIGEGTGLGLSICHGIVTSLGGEISVSSELGHGCVFYVTLPGRSSGEAQPRPEKRRLLIVDDEAEVGRALARELGTRYRVVVAASGAEALELLMHDDRFDLVLVDVAMPGMGGVELHDAIHKSRPGVHERFVFMSGQRLPHRLEKLPNAHLQKPFSAAEVDALVRKRTR